MIKSFSSKALELLWEENVDKKLPQSCVDRLKRILTLLNSTKTINDLGAVSKSFRLHQLKGPPFKGFWSLDVNANYRVIFRLVDGNVYDVNFVDTH
ncbi:type II toxin-antitoxin system RelE/ParE family toxin [Sphingobacterium hungaricum]|uniref:Proteic killer suppression protein n=1 Tax=Sphingobacterium hungaricum TaxID=2082723 RepID=A0A928UTV8_9SPHI|nr:type II toxin-antitoxin system RelE/ParE family toxin [Sphingobacterium hungaricum]MBE8713251.1 hypothetical protein [Sphingobacterium hungaricum]